MLNHAFVVSAINTRAVSNTEEHGLYSIYIFHNIGDICHYRSSALQSKQRPLTKNNNKIQECVVRVLEIQVLSFISS